MKEVDVTRQEARPVRDALLKVDRALRDQLKVAAALEKRLLIDITEEALRDWMRRFNERRELSGGRISDLDQPAVLSRE